MTRERRLLIEVLLAVAMLGGCGVWRLVAWFVARLGQ
jgi:hypothetical protein